MYKHYKQKTLKANSQDDEFAQNMKFREFFLGIKKRFDVRFRAQKFRAKKKRELTELKKVAEKEVQAHDPKSEPDRTDQ